MTDEQQIRWIYRGYVRGLYKSERIKSKSERARYLAQWLAEPVLTDRVDGSAEFRRQGYRTKGTPIPHDVEATVTGQTGKVKGCTDERPLITTNTKTGKSEHGTGVWHIISLTRTHQGWRINGVDFGKRTCDPDKY